MIGVSLLGILLMFLKKLETIPMYLWLLVPFAPLPLIACQTGWIVAEVGRQPWVVYRLLKTADAFSTNVPAEAILFSLIAFTLIYAMLGALYLFVLFRKIGKGIEPKSE